MRFLNRSEAASFSAKARWRAAEARADAERAEGIPDRQPVTEWRRECVLDLRGAGGPLLRLEPRAGYIAWRRVSESGQVEDCAALKTLLHRLADELTPQMSARNR